MASIIDGKKIAEEIRSEIAHDAGNLKNSNCIPCLGVLLVGENPASHVYVRMKEKACQKAGIRTITNQMDKSASQEDVYDAVMKYNEDSTRNTMPRVIPEVIFRGAGRGK